MRTRRRDGRFFNGSSGVSRRQALQGIGVSVSALALGCDGSAPAGPQDPMDPMNPADPMDPMDPMLPPPTAAELLAGIEAVVVLMMENRSFDHYLGALRSDGSYAKKDDVEGLHGDETNPTGMGLPIKVFRTKNRTPKDPPHGWDSCHAQWNGGKNDGFVREHASAGSEQGEVMGFHDRAAIPLYYALADRFTVCDRWFSSVMGPTWPNRYYLHAATSFGKKNNSPIDDGKAQTVWDGLKKKGLSGKNYHAGIAPFYAGGFVAKVLSGVSPTARIDDFFAAARDGKLPAFSMIDPDFLSNDDHPSHDINLGQAFVASVVRAIAKSPQWNKTLLCITYDEHGGFFDHLPPPTLADERPEFEQLGFRVPTLCLGGAVRTGVNHTVFNHASVAATLKTRFGIDSLGPRMDASADLSSVIDPQRLKNPVPPPLDLPTIRVDLRAALAGLAEAESSQPEIDEMVRRGIIPPSQLDSRPHHARLRAWLTEAERLGAVELVNR